MKYNVNARSNGTCVCRSTYQILGRHKAHSKRGWERPVSSSGPCQLRRAGGSGSRRAIHKPAFDVDARAECAFLRAAALAHLRGAGVVSVAGDYGSLKPQCV